MTNEEFIIQFIDESKEEKSEPIQVPSNITIAHLRQLTKSNANLFAYGNEITTTLAEALLATQHNSEEIIPIRFSIDENTSKPALFCSSSLSGHEQAVLGVKIHKNKLVSIGGDFTVRFWDMITKIQYKIQKVNEHWVTCVDTSDKYVVIGSMDGKMSLFNWEGEFVRHFAINKKGVSIVKFRDAESIFAAGRDGSVCLFKISGEQIFSYKHTQAVDDLIVENDTVISCGRDFLIKVYENMKLLYELKFHTKRINCIVKNKDFLVSCSDDYSIIIYDAKNKYKKLREMRHQNIVMSVAISSNGMYLASASFDRTVRVWDIHSGKQLMNYYHVSSVYKVFFNNNLVVSFGKDQLIKQFCVKQKKIVSELRCGDEIYASDTDGKVLVCACKDRKVYFFN